MTTMADDEKAGGLMTSDLRDKILIAEGLRRDRKSQKAEQLFAQLENEEGLSSIQRRWIQAHHAAAILDQYLPFRDLEDKLDDAEKMLRKLLHVEAGLPNDPSGAEVKYPWAWARLGDVYRLRGNLPSLVVTPSRLPGVQARDESPGVRLTDRNNLDDYHKAERCFKIALAQRPNYPWVHAHYAALLVNLRRYHSVRPDHSAMADRNRGADIKEAQTQISKALDGYHYLYPWALFYRGCVQFFSCLNNLVDDIKAGKASSDKEAEFLFMTYSIVLALLQDPPAMYRHPMQPGTIGRDEYLSLSYDLLDFLPELAWPHVPPNDVPPDDAQRRRAFIEQIENAVKAGKPVLAVDDMLPGSERLRFLYAELYLFHYKTQIIYKALLPGGWEGLIFQMVTLAGELDSASEAVSGQALWSAPDRDSQLYLRAFDVLMILLKIGVILKNVNIIRSPKTQEIIENMRNTIRKHVKIFNGHLGVLKGLEKEPEDELKGLGEDKKVDVDLTLEKIANLTEDNAWLLAPLWPLTPDRVEVLKEFLVFFPRRPTQP